jgi:hypothetical protein
MDMNGRTRAQASLFDGITFLMLVMASVVMLFVSLSSYGQLQNTMVNQAHIQNYMLDAFKSIYYIDASTLSGVTCKDEPYYCRNPDACSSDVRNNVPGYPNCNMGCDQLKNWTGITVAELIKKDMRDFDVSNPTATGLDDMYGSSPAPGKLAARCAFMKILEPFSTAGYSYLVQFQKVNGQQPIMVPEVPDQYGGNITNNNQIASCDQVMGGEETVANSPFEVFQGQMVEGNMKYSGQNYVMTACMWPTRNTTASTG